MSKKKKNQHSAKDTTPMAAHEDRTTILSDTVRLLEFQSALEAIQAPACLVWAMNYCEGGRRESDNTQITRTLHHQEGQLWPLLKKPEFVLGRAPESDIYIDDLSVSKQHARFEIKNNKVHIVDLGSTNKTKVNEQEIQAYESTPLVNGDTLHIGRLMFKFFDRGTLEARVAQDDFKRAHVDPLTRISNRRALASSAHMLFKQAKSLHHDLSLMVFDIDFFKKINDTYGHDAGDFILKKLAALVNDSMMRNNDVCARFGGEEFVLLFQQPLDKAVDIAWRINKLIASHDFSYRGKKIETRISAGVTSRQADDACWEDMLHRADELLYKAKNQGRDQVVADSARKKQVA